MRIALVISSLQMGGMETVLKSLGTFFVKNGDKVEFVEAESQGVWSSYFQSLGFPVRTIPLTWRKSKIEHSKDLAKVLNRYDVVMLNDVPYVQASLGMLEPRVIAIPIIHLDMPSFIANAAGNAGQWDKVVAVSPLLKERFLGNTICGPMTIDYIANGVEVSDDWSKIGVDFDSVKPMNVVFSGRIENKQKGANLLPNIVQAVNATGASIHLNVIGDGPDLIKLRETFEARKISNVCFYGSLTHAEAIKILCKNDVLVMPSFFEGMPISLLEAMANGLVPLVSNLIGSTDLIVKDKVNGYLITPGNYEEFAAAICALEKNRLKLKEMSRLAWESIKKDFSTERMGNAYLQLIENLTYEKNSSNVSTRSRSIDISLLGDLPRLPFCLIRPVRKILKVMKLYKF